MSNCEFNKRVAGEKDESEIKGYRNHEQDIFIPRRVSKVCIETG